MLPASISPGKAAQGQSPKIPETSGMVGGLLAGCGGEDRPEAEGEDRVVLSPPDDTTGHTHEGTASAVRLGDGTTPQAGGYRLVDVSLPAPGAPGDVSFRVLDPAGRPLTSYTVEQTKELHLYVVRSDLAEFRHLHPTRSADGTWTARVALATAGSYRVLAEFTPGTGADGPHVALGDTVLVPGDWEPVDVTTVPGGATAALAALEREAQTDPYLASYLQVLTQTRAQRNSSAPDAAAFTAETLLQRAGRRGTEIDAGSRGGSP